MGNSESPSDRHSDPLMPPRLSALLYFLTGNPSVFIINSPMEVFHVTVRNFILFL